MKPASSWVPPNAALPALVVVLGLALSAWSALQVHERAQRSAQAAFTRLAGSVGTEVQRRFTLPLYGLRGALGTLAASDRVQRHEFRTLVDALALDTQFPGVRGFGFIQRVPEAEEQAFVREVRADGAPDFEIRELVDGGQDDHYFIRYIEPLARNQPAWGLDVGSEPSRRAAIEQAIDSGQPALTAPVALVQDGRRSPGFLLYLPAYRQGAAVGTSAERREALLGVLYAPIVAAELLEGLSATTAGQVDFRLVHAATGRPVFESTPATAVEGPAGPAPVFETVAALDVVGSRIRLSVHGTPAFERQARSSEAWLVLAFGGLLSALLAYGAHRLVARQRDAEGMARRYAAERERLAMVARHTSNAVVITDAARRISWVNEGFERVTGYRMDEAMGRSPGDLLQSPDTDPEVVARMRAALDERRAFRGELLNRAKDGRPYWLELEIQPLFEADGALGGYMAIESDITERRQAEAALAAARRETDALLDTIRTHGIVSMAGSDGRIVEVNDAFCASCGYSRDELLGQDHRLLNSGVHPPTFWAGMWQTLAAGRSWRGEVCNRARDGSLYWVDSIVAPFVGADGTIEKYMSVRTDITAIKRASEELARERARLALIIDGTGAGTWEIDFETGEDQINEAYARMLGYTSQALSERIAGNFQTLVHPDDRDGVSRARQAHLDSDADDYEVEFRMQHREGHWVWIHSRGRVGRRDATGKPLRMAGIHLDITERKRSEQALRASQALLDTTGRIASVGGWMLELGSGQLTWSAQTCRMHDLPPGHQPTLDEAIGYYAPSARERIRALVQRGMATGEPWDEELALVTAAGRSIWVRAMGELERTEGRPVRLVGALQDITERRTMAEELRRGGEVMSSIVENLPCAVSVFNERLELVASNRKYRELLGFPDTMFQGRLPRYEEFIRLNAERGEYGEGDPEEIVARTVQRARTLGNQPHRFERVRPDGTPIEIQGAPMPGGGFVSTYTDISERKRAEAQVQRSAELLRGAIEVIDEAFVLYDPDDRLVLCNDRYRQTYAGVADLILPGVRFEDLVRAGARRGDYVEAVGREEEWVRERVALHQRADSTIIQRLENGRTLRIVERRLPDGHIVGFRIDVSELTQAKEAAEQASRAKSQFLVNMSHEIRTPMNAILGLLTLLRRSGLDERQADYAAKTEGAARSLLGLLNDILDFSKAEAGKMLLDPQPFRVGPWVQDLSAILQAGVHDKPVALRFELDPEVPPALTGDALRLQQVLLNLGGNAIKFTPRGEVVVRIVLVARTGREVRLEVSVQDTGIGIAPENHARIFSGFTQAEASTTRRFGGTGLGVAICQRLVALMGGELRLDSAPGLGSRFWFELTLPIADEQRLPRPVASGGPAGQRLAGLRLLLVEDNANNQLVARELLEDEGARVQVADNGRLAVAAVADAAQPFDAVLMDLQMPEMDGYTATSRIRQDLGRLDLPIVAMTANAMASDREACLAAGMNEHVGKPFDLDQLVAVLRRVTGRDLPLPGVEPARSSTVATDWPPVWLDAAAQAGVDLPGALARMGSRAGPYRKLLRRFVRDLSELPAGLRSQAREADLGGLRRELHSLKGLAGTLGVDRLSRQAAEADRLLARTADGLDAPAIESMLAPLVDAVEQLAPILQALCDAMADGGTARRRETATAAEPAAIRAAIQTLERLLADADMDAVSVMEHLRAAHADRLGDRLEPLDDAVARLDFDSALRICQALLQETTT